MNTRKKVIIIIVCICSYLLVIGFTFHILIASGTIHLPAEETMLHFDKHKDDFKVPANDILNQTPLLSNAIQRKGLV